MWAENLCRAIFSQQRIYHVARDSDCATPDPFIQARQIKRFKAAQIAWQTCQTFSVRIEEMNAERLQDSNAAINRRTAANAENDIADSFVQRASYQFTRAERRRM